MILRFPDPQRWIELRMIFLSNTNRDSRSVNSRFIMSDSLGVPFADRFNCEVAQNSWVHSSKSLSYRHGNMHFMRACSARVINYAWGTVTAPHTITKCESNLSQYCNNRHKYIKGSFLSLFDRKRWTPIPSAADYSGPLSQFVYFNQNLLVTWFLQTHGTEEIKIFLAFRLKAIAYYFSCN